VLFEFKHLNDWKEDEIISRYLGKPKTEPLVLQDGAPAPTCAPTHLVEPVDYTYLEIQQLSGKIFIVDFGEAFFNDRVPDRLVTHWSVATPERHFGILPSFATDLWALGCLIFELHTCRPFLSSFQSHIGELVSTQEMIGALPEEWKLMCRALDPDDQDILFNC
jgi:serine/threonine protein kinase